eukprot:CAMPEP_0115431638 /NCGR_PEP_ID=MMETSP0271-20121206/31677_1 /TAXON_ID=71861 /ORGANISM="Scrippsiella trochoidea, Strain CCMP3099" /LENGTH=109 /DNA_ID=CAMNT_0002856931 /DNA_START=24 /DNA_END=350 /DNA_ORIENTATION=+
MSSMSLPRGVIPIAAASTAGLVLAKYLHDRRASGSGGRLAEPVPFQELPLEVIQALRKAAAEHPSRQEPADGCTAAVTVAYAFAETIFIFPITPTTPLGETADQWAVAG